jgi:glycosyltransferase involved in cell wall biosynthesis
LKVLQVGKYYPPARGGMETHLEQLCQQLKTKVELEVIVSNHCDGEEYETVNGVTVRRLKASTTIAGAPICLDLPRAIRQAKADIIHVHTPHPSALLGYLASGAPGHLVCTYHSDIVRQKTLGMLLAPLQSAAFRRAKAIIVSNPNILATSPVLARHRELCAIASFGIECSFYETPNERAVDTVRRQFGAPIVLAVGRLVYYKGFEFLIRAIARLPDVAALVIIGEGPLRSRLEAEIGALGLRGRVHLLGNVPDPSVYYHACDVFVLPSIARSEAFGIVQLEAMACGKPVINTRIEGSGVSFVSCHGKTGLTVTPADASALAKAIADLLRDDLLRAQLGRAGKQRVREHFTLQGMRDRTLAVYHRVMAGLPVSGESL